MGLRPWVSTSDWGRDRVVGFLDVCVGRSFSSSGGFFLPLVLLSHLFLCSYVNVPVILVTVVATGSWVWGSGVSGPVLALDTGNVVEAVVGFDWLVWFFRWASKIESCLCS